MPKGTQNIKFERLDKDRILIPKTGAMRVDGIVFVSESMMKKGMDDAALVQVANVATLPGIVGASLAMPDIHWGYGFPIGGVAAFDEHDGIISPGGVGYDINCGVRLLRSDLSADEIKDSLPALVRALFAWIPTGVGSHQKEMTLSKHEIAEVSKKGARWAVERGFGVEEDLAFLEEQGCIRGASFDVVSDKAYERGRKQLGTLGSGNHFVEIGVVEEVYDEKVASAFGLEKGKVTVTIHTGSRGFGHQICTDFIPIMDKAARNAGIYLPDRQLACAPIRSSEGQRYYQAMASAANFAFANRQIISDEVRRAFEEVLGRSWRDMGLRVVYDVAHNIAKREVHEVGGRKVTLYVHRKGATRALAAGHEALPDAYKDVGQPVLVPGDMGRYSYVLVGSEKAMKDTFASSCHGAGRVLSRHEAIRQGKKRDIKKELKDKGILVMVAGSETLAEEMPDAYKDVEDVVEVVHSSGIAKKVVKIRPMGVIKG